MAQLSSPPRSHCPILPLQLDSQGFWGCSGGGVGVQTISTFQACLLRPSFSPFPSPITTCSHTQTPPLLTTSEARPTPITPEKAGRGLG